MSTQIYIFTFWKNDFVSLNLEQLIAILKQDSVKAKGYWFKIYENFIEAHIDIEQYTFIMNNVANYGNKELNK